MKRSLQPNQTGSSSSLHMESTPGPALRPHPSSNTPKRSKRPLDRVLPTKIHDVVPESKLYTQLQNFERKIDSFVTRKRLDLLEQRQRLAPVNRTLRVFISNFASDQYVADASTKTGIPEDALGPTPKATNDPNSQDDKQEQSLANTEAQRTVPGWTLRIEGRLLDPPNSRRQQQPQPKFTTFIKSVVVNLEQDQNSHPDGNILEWIRDDSDQPTDGIELKRIGDSNVPAKIMLFLDSPTQKFKLSSPLSKFLNIHTDTLNNVISAVWKYIKQNKLQDSEDKRMIICDRQLRDIFGEDKFSFAQLPSLLAMHFLPADPVLLEYTIRTDVPHNVGKFAYDIDLEVPNPIKEDLDSLLLSHFSSYSNVYEQTFGKPPSQLGTESERQHAQLVREIQSIDESITENIQNLVKTETKIEFLSSFVEDPVNFINKWSEGQAKDASSILGDTISNVEIARHAENYQKDSVKDAVFQYLETR